MPLACKVYELSGAPLSRVVEALERGEPRVSARRTSTGAVGFAELSGGLRIPFEIYNFRGRVFLLVLAGRRRAAKVAGIVSQLIDADVAEVSVRPERVLQSYEGSVVKLVVLDMVRAPGLRRIVLSGDAVSDSELYRELSALSEIRYVLFQTGDGRVLGVSSSCTVVALSKISEEDLLSAVKEVLLPLVSPLV